MSGENDKCRLLLGSRVASLTFGSRRGNVHFLSPPQRGRDHRPCFFISLVCIYLSYLFPT